MSLANLGIKLFGAKVLINVIKKENGGHLGRDIGNATVRWLNRQLGKNKKTGRFCRRLALFVVDFCDAFTEVLFKRCEK